MLHRKKHTLEFLLYGEYCVLAGASYIEIGIRIMLLLGTRCAIQSVPADTDHLVRK